MASSRWRRAGFTDRRHPVRSGPRPRHDDVNAKLSERRYFFLDVKRRGRLLYDTRRYRLAERRALTPEEEQRLAESDCEQWYERARAFYEIHELTYQKGDLKMAAFNLDQAAESAYKALLPVFTGYCPHAHPLSWLGQQAERSGPVYREIFPRDEQKAQKRIELLDRAYIGARYRKDFQVFWGDVE